MALRRRGLLSAVAAGATVTAGCIDGFAGRNDRETSTPAGVEAVGCPDYERRNPERVVCSVDPPEDALVFEPDPETADLPRAEIACRLENELDERFETNFYDWNLHKYDGEAWQFLGPYLTPQPLHYLEPGDTHVRRLVVDNSDLERVDPPETEDRAGEYVSARHGLGPGVYALSISSSSEGPATVYAAAFELRGEPVPLVPPATVESEHREGDRKVLEVSRTLEGGDADRFDLTVRREPEPPREPRAFVDEQLYHPWYPGLRAALTAFETGVSEVVVRGDDSQMTRDLAGGRGPDFAAYDGVTYALEVDPHDG